MTAFTPHRPRKKGSRLRVFIFWFLFLVLIGVAGQEVYYRYQVAQPSDVAAQVIPFTISKSEFPTSVADRLEDQGFVSSSWVFLRYSERSGDAQNFQAGRFYLKRGHSIPELSQILTKAAPKEITVTIPEGFTNADIDARLADLKLIESGEFVDCVANCDFSKFPFLPQEAELREGFFFPDTYFVSPETFSVERFSQRLLSTFDDKTKSIFGKADRNGWEILKMASIVEKESRKADEQPVVAGILWKRLDNNWMLGADATTRYIVGKVTEALTAEDLANESPWNTRANTGLPPGAICNPGLTAITAAANPEESEYWYYLHAPDGQIHYAQTVERHNLNKHKYLR